MIVFKCDCCGFVDENENPKIFHNAYILGSDDMLCWFCFEAWYDSGKTTRMEVIAESRRLRARAQVPA